MSSEVRTVEFSVENGRFETSTDFTEYMYHIAQMLNDPLFVNYAAMTDQNFSTETRSKLQAAIDAYQEFVNEMNSAE